MIPQSRKMRLGLSCLLGVGLTVLLPATLAAQTSSSSPAPVIRTFPLPKSSSLSSEKSLPEEQIEDVVYESKTVETTIPKSVDSKSNSRQKTDPQYDYRLPFNRDLSVGNRIRLEGIYSSTALYFSRPRNWDLTSAKVQVKLQHSPSLLPNESNLVARVNDTSIGSVPLDRSETGIASIIFNIPLNLIQEENFLTLEVEQNTSETCTNPNDPTLWTEILPDSEFLFQFKIKDYIADFTQYPYPFFDDLSLDPTQVAYLEPTTFDSSWLTTTARYQASMGRLADYRRLESRLVDSVDELSWNERLIVIGTPGEQPMLKSFDLPFRLKENQLLDGDNQPLSPEIGVLAQTAVLDTGNPILVATGNGPEGVTKAIQFLVQSQGQQIGTGAALLVEDLPEVASPDPQDWPRYLPQEDDFLLSDLTDLNGSNFEDITVRGTNASPVQIDFRMLPHHQLNRGSSVTVHYSHSSQVNPRTSSIAVILDEVIIGSKSLSSRNSSDQTYQVSLPTHLVKPDSKIQIQFMMDPQDSEVCGISTQKQLWGTLHSDTRFNLSRSTLVKVPDLKLLQAGYPLTAPQDLSQTAIALPDKPSRSEIETLLALSGRLGKLSQSEGLKLDVYQTGSIPGEVRDQYHWVGIGLRERFPFAEAFSTSGLGLMQQFTRQWQGSQIQSIQDNEGMIKSMLSPWNDEYLLFALTAQTETGLQEVQDGLNLDSLFFALEGDTALISRSVPNPSPYSREDYSLEFLSESPQKQLVEVGVIKRGSLFFENNWSMLPVGIVLLALVLYSIAQLYLNRISDTTKS